jgi:c-di-AMP phosphodiesterase-like protein
MKTYLSFTFLLTVLFLFSACSVKLDPITLNSAILQNISDTKTYSTYDQSEGKITQYFFKRKNGELEVRDAITYIPMDYTDQLYSPFSQVTWTLKRLTNNRAKTIEEALDLEVAKYNYTFVFLNKNEYLIGNDFARDIIYSIDRFEEMIQRQEDRRDRVNLKLIFPIM